MKRFFPSNIMLIPFVVKNYSEEEQEANLDPEQETEANKPLEQEE